MSNSVRFGNLTECSVGVNLNSAVDNVVLSERRAPDGRIVMQAALFPIAYNIDKSVFGLNQTNSLVIYISGKSQAYKVQVTDMGGQDLYFVIHADRLIGQTGYGYTGNIGITRLERY